MRPCLQSDTSGRARSQVRRVQRPSSSARGSAISADCANSASSPARGFFSARLQWSQCCLRCSRFLMAERRTLQTPNTARFHPNTRVQRRTRVRVRRRVRRRVRPRPCDRVGATVSRSRRRFSRFSRASSTFHLDCASNRTCSNCNRRRLKACSGNDASSRTAQVQRGLRRRTRRVSMRFRRSSRMRQNTLKSCARNQFSMSSRATRQSARRCARRSPLQAQA